MDPKTQYFDEVKALPDSDSIACAASAGVEWAVPAVQGPARAQRAADGNFPRGDPDGPGRRHSWPARRAILVLGSIEPCASPTAVLVDRTGYDVLLPRPAALEPGKTLEMNDQRVKIAGIFDSSAPFTNLPGFLHPL